MFVFCQDALYFSRLDCFSAVGSRQGFVSVRVHDLQQISFSGCFGFVSFPELYTREMHKSVGGKENPSLVSSCGCCPLLLLLFEQLWKEDGFFRAAEVPSQNHLREVNDVITGASIDHVVSEDESSKIRNLFFGPFGGKTN